MAIAIVPQSVSDVKNSNRNSWLAKDEADEMFCLHFGVDVDPHDYFNDWFRKFRIFDWYYTNKDKDYAISFDTFEDAVKHVKSVGEKNECDYLIDVLPFLGILYGRGYKMVALDLA